MVVFAFLNLLLFVGVTWGLSTWEVPKTESWKHFTADLDLEWVGYKKAYNRTYEGEEEIYRRLFWEDSLKFIRKHNLKYYRGESSFFLGENDFADMADDEFEKIYLKGLMIPDDLEHPPGLDQPDPEAPSGIDWVQKGLVGPVKNQGRCGSCWAFSAVAAIEGQQKKVHGGRIMDLSEQNLVDCANQRYGNYGCRGGWMANAFKYVERNGLDTENCYRYTGSDNYCRTASCPVAVNEKSHVSVGRSEYSLQSAVAKKGPVSIAVDVSSRGFRFYRGGVLNDNQCSSSHPNHAMAAVGYGSYGGSDYWKVKNSWGQNWGQNGYVFMSRNRGNQCGIAGFASYPVL